jgi:hypothetical protein
MNNPCKCKVIDSGLIIPEPNIFYCPMHLNAPAMLEALKEVLPLAEAYLKSAPGHPDNAKLEDARAAIRAAEGKK